MIRTALLAALLLQQQPAAARRAAALVESGVELSHAGRFEEAGARFAEAAALDPANAEAHYLLGLTRQQAGRTEAALGSFQTAVRLRPRYAEAQARVCELLTVMARARETGYEEARAACRRAIALAPSDAEAHFHLGSNEARLGGLAEATAAFETVLRLDASYRGARFELAMAYADSQQTARAIPLLRQVVAAEPGNGNARFQLGSALVKSGDCAAAVAMLEAATESAQKHYLLAGCYRKLGRAAESDAAMARVRELREGADARMQAKYRAAVAHKHLEAGKLDAAIAEYRAALELGPDAALEIDLAVALLRKGDASGVVRLLAGNADPLARYQVALAYSKLGRTQDAAAFLELVIAERPQMAEAWYQLGVVSLALGKAADAERAAGRAAALRADEPVFRRAWAEALQRLGRTREAAEQKALAARMEKR